MTRVRVLREPAIELTGVFLLGLIEIYIHLRIGVMVYLMSVWFVGLSEICLDTGLQLQLQVVRYTPFSIH